MFVLQHGLPMTGDCHCGDCDPVSTDLFRNTSATVCVIQVCVFSLCVYVFLKPCVSGPVWVQVHTHQWLWYPTEVNRWWCNNGRPRCLLQAGSVKPFSSCTLLGSVWLSRFHCRMPSQVTRCLEGVHASTCVWSRATPMLCQSTL